MALRFRWDPRKAAANARKHGMTFPEAATAFADGLSITIEDPDHSVGERRFLLVGMTAFGHLGGCTFRAGKRDSDHQCAASEPR